MAAAALTMSALVPRERRSRHGHRSKRRRLLGVQEKSRFFDSLDLLHSQIDDQEQLLQAVARPLADDHTAHEELVLQLAMEEEKEEEDGEQEEVYTDLDDMPSLEGPTALASALAPSPSPPLPLPSPPPARPPLEFHFATMAAPPLSTMIPSSVPPPLPRAKTNASRPPSPPFSLRAPHDPSHSVPNSPAKSKVPHFDSAVSAAVSRAGPVGLFDSLSLVLVQGPELTAKRCELLTVQVRRRGGRISSVTADGELLAHEREREREREREASLKHSPTHVLFGSMGGGYDGRLREYTQRLKTQILPQKFDAIKFLSVEWLTSCLRKNARSKTDRYEWREPHGSRHPGDAPTLTTQTDERLDDALASVPPPLPASLASTLPPLSAGASSYALSAASASALAAAATQVPKRDIRYVLESLDQQAAAASAAATSSTTVKQEPGPMLDSAALARAKREHLAERRASWKRKSDASNLSSPPPPSVALSPAEGESLLSGTYSQAVPVFSDVVHYDPTCYLPLSTGASYLNPDLPVAADASFLQRPPEFGSDSGSGSQSVFSSPSRPKKPADPAAPPPAAAAASVVSFHPQPGAAKAGAWLEKNKAHLACQMFSSQHRNLNSHITGPLETLENMNGSLGDKWRTYAYRKAVGILKKYPRRICTQEDVLALAGIRGLGAKLLNKVSEIVATGGLRKVAAMEQNELIATMALFSKIHGVGSATAQKWYTWGLRTIEDVLRDPRVQLSATQKVGLQFMDDKAQRIPRLEVTSILDYVTRIANRLLPGVTVICCGSFRRGAPTSGDVDLLFTHPTFTSRDLGNDVEDPESVKQREAFLRQLLALLHEPIQEGSPRWNEEREWAIGKYAAVKAECDRIKVEVAQKAAEQAAAATGSPPQPDVDSATPTAAKRSHSLRPPPCNSFLTGDLSSFEKLSSQHGSAYYMGFCALPKYHPFHSGVNRRLDIKVYPVSHFPFALLYFTGSDHFNRCWGAGTTLLMADGTTKAVEHIVEGDRLMGPDSTPRVVRAGSLVRGHTARDAETRSALGQLCLSKQPLSPAATYEIVSKSGGRQTWTCNEQHVLVLQWHRRPTFTVLKDRSLAQLTVWRLKHTRDVPCPSPHSKFFRLSPTGLPSKQAQDALRLALARWEPLTWEVSAADFMAYPKAVRASCKMFAPAVVHLPPLEDPPSSPRTLAARLTLLMRKMDLLPMNAQADSDLVRHFAWLLGVAFQCTPSTDLHAPLLCGLQHRSRLARSGQSSDHPRHDVDPLLLRRLFESYELFGTRRLPRDLLHESKQIRVALLTGIIQGGGALSATTDSIVRSTSEAQLEDVRFLARSIGLSVGDLLETDECYSIQIAGTQLLDLDLHFISSRKRSTSRKNPSGQLAAGFTCRQVAHAEYFGFQVDGPDSRLLMSDFVVTHNSMRYFAKQKRWTLSDHGLAPAIRVNGDKVWSGKSVYCATEKDVFDALGLMYVPPEQRNVYAHFELTEEEMRMLKHNNALQAAASAEHTSAPTSAPPAVTAAAFSSSSSSSAAAAAAASFSALSPLTGGPLKQEVALELAEMDAVSRAAMGLRRLAQEEAAILQNQLAGLHKQLT